MPQIFNIFATFLVVISMFYLHNDLMTEEKEAISIAPATSNNHNLLTIHYIQGP